MYTGSLFDLSIEEMMEELKKREEDIKKMDKKSKKPNKIQKTKKNPKSSFRFYKSKMESRYTTYRSYLEARCESLPNQIGKIAKCEARHTASRCRGMSNYIDIFKNDDESITIRISDHAPTGSGSPCDYYIYIQDKTWMEVKKEVFEIAENFLK